MKKHLIVGTALWLLGACADSVPTENKPCPCADGNVCCASGVCARDQTSCDAAAAQSLLLQAKGSWKGYVENYTFASGGDTIKLDFDVTAGGALSGRVVFGREGLPAPTDPNVGWPPSNAYTWIDVGPRPFFAEGFIYTARSITWDRERLKFSLSSREAWSSWCALQTSYPWGGDTYGCRMNTGFGGSSPGDCYVTTDSGNQPIDCGKLSLCKFPGDEPCTCTATGCRTTPLSDITIDIALRDGVGDGSVRFREGSPNNIRVTRM